MIQDYGIDSSSTCVFSIPSHIMKLLVAPKISAICITTDRHATLDGKRDSGRLGTHRGKNSFLLNEDLYDAKTARQNINLQKKK